DVAPILRVCRHLVAGYLQYFLERQMADLDLEEELHHQLADVAAPHSHSSTMSTSAPRSTSAAPTHAPATANTRMSSAHHQPTHLMSKAMRTPTTAPTT